MGVGAVRVRRTAFTTANDSHVTLNKHDSVLPSVATNNKRSLSRPLPDCFVCAEKHYLVDCDKFKVLPNNFKRQTVVDSGRCLNCLSVGHNVRNCGFPCKCRKCRPNYHVKHAIALHDCYQSPSAVSDGAADLSRSVSVHQSDSEQVEPAIVRKVESLDRRVVLLRTCAVRVGLEPRYQSINFGTCPT